MPRCPRCKYFHGSLTLNPELRLCHFCENSIPELTTETKEEVDAILAVEEAEEARNEQSQLN